MSPEEEVKAVDEEFESDKKDTTDKPENKKSRLHFMKSMLPKYFEGEWSFARFKVPTDDNDLR